MADNKQQLNQLLMRIDAAALSEDYESVERLITEARTKLDNVRLQLDPDVASSVENSLSQISRLVPDQGTSDQSFGNRYKADRPKKGEKGRPTIDITREELNAFRSANFSVKGMAEQFGCSTKTVRRRLLQEGLNKKFSTIPDQSLDEQVTELKSSFPNAGSQMVQGYLEARGITVQRRRARDSLKRVDPEGSTERYRKAVHRRVYQVATPNSLWHMDGHMKLIRWGFSTHGCIDGYSRMITFLHCSTRNTSSTVLSLFVEACNTYGIPTKVRSDHGGENSKVALFLNLVRQEGSHITGKSVHNQRIERLWRDVHYQVTSKFYHQFYEMEDNPDVSLDVNNENHRMALQHVFLPVINAHLEEFRKGWNSHKMRSEHQMTPYQLWMSGMLGNMNSGHTASSELFRESHVSLEERLENGLSRFGLTTADLEDETGVDDPTGISADKKEEIDNAIRDVITCEEKFLKCVEILENTL